MTQAATDPAPAPPTGALAPFRHRVFRDVWLASALSNLGGMIQSVGAAWLMLSLTHSAKMVALVQASVALPVMLFSLAAGAVADNFDRRHVLLAAQVSMLVVAVALAVFAWSGLLTPWTLLGFTFLLGCGSAFNSPAWQASVGDMVPRAELPGAVALNSMGFNIARSVGPALGGFIVARAGAAVAFACNALSYIALIVVLARWRPETPARVLPREALGTAMAAGLRYVALSPAIRTVLLRSALFGLGASSLMALMPVVAKTLVAGDAFSYGLLLGAFGVGAIGGALASARLRSRLSTERIVRVACVGFAAAAATTALSAELYATMVALALAGATWVLALSTFNVAVQLSAPRWVVARTLSLYQMAAFGGIAAGAALWGAVAESQGVATALFGAAGVLVACALVGIAWPLAQSQALDLDPLREWQAPETAVPVEPRTGPVVVTIEYVIDEHDVLEFLRAMAERRRIRRRDGALAWSLLRDLSDPRIWIERYKTPTWLDYIRLNQRVTKDDAYVPERLRELHRGAESPRVRRLIERQVTANPAPRTETVEPPTDPSAG